LGLKQLVGSKYRYYYKKNILLAVEGKKLVYQFSSLILLGQSDPINWQARHMTPEKGHTTSHNDHTTRQNVPVSGSKQMDQGFTWPQNNNWCQSYPTEMHVYQTYPDMCCRADCFATDTCMYGGKPDTSLYPAGVSAGLHRTMDWGRETQNPSCCCSGKNAYIHY
jgi:hypothetical protein